MEHTLGGSIGSTTILRGHIAVLHLPSKHQEIPRRLGCKNENLQNQWFAKDCDILAELALAVECFTFIMDIRLINNLNIYF